MGAGMMTDYSLADGFTAAKPNVTLWADYLPLVRGPMARVGPS